MLMPDFGKQGGLVPVIAQDFKTGDVLMLAYMNEEAFKLTVNTGTAHYFSRSKNRIWKKGEISGNMQRIAEIRIDCDEDALLLKVEQTGAACHEGYRSCFFRELKEEGFVITEKRIMNPDEIYEGKK